MCQKKKYGCSCKTLRKLDEKKKKKKKNKSGTENKNVNSAHPYCYAYKVTDRIYNDQRTLYDDACLTC